MYTLESPHRGDSNDGTKHNLINIKRKITRNYPKYNRCNASAMGLFFFFLFFFSSSFFC